MFEQIIIVGGGQSIQQGLEQGLHSKISKCFTIGCNYSFKYFNPTFNTFVDGEFYKTNKNILKHRLCSGHYANLDEPKESPEVYWLPPSIKYSTIKETKSVYNPMLVGIWSISLAIYLMKGNGTIYLLGYDWTKKNTGNTHFYQGKIEHSGINKTDFYDEQEPNKWFAPFLKEKGVNIYNVNPESNINTFEKVNYFEMFGKLKDEPYSQDYLREYVRTKLEPIRVH